MTCTPRSNRWLSVSQNEQASNFPSPKMTPPPPRHHHHPSGTALSQICKHLHIYPCHVPRCLVERLCGFRNEWMLEAWCFCNECSPFLSMSRESNSGLWWCVVSQNHFELVCVERFPLFANHSPSLNFWWSFPTRPRSALKRFLPNRHNQNVTTLLIMGKKSTCKISPSTLNDLGFLRPKRWEWAFLMITSVFLWQVYSLSIKKSIWPPVKQSVSDHLLNSGALTVIRS